MPTKKIKFRNIETGKTVFMWQTTDHFQVSYGLPVWVDKDNYCYGQCDLWPVPFGFEPVLERKVLVTWLETEQKELFSGLSPFFKKYPDYKKNKSNIEKYLSRLNQPYKIETIIIERLIVQR